MEKRILCLANSHKYHERCISGIEVASSITHTMSLVRNGNRPKWLRPVTSSTGGEINRYYANRIQMLDIVEFSQVQEIPNGYQSENVLITQSSIKVVGHTGFPPKKALAELTDDKMPTIFGNFGKAVHHAHIKEVDHSIVFIKPEAPFFIKVSNRFNQGQLRADFIFNGHKYNLPVTDENFLRDYHDNPEEWKSLESIYFTITLGLMFQGWHYKLVSGILKEPAL